MNNRVISSIANIFMIILGLGIVSYQISVANYQSVSYQLSLTLLVTLAFAFSIVNLSATIRLVVELKNSYTKASVFLAAIATAVWLAHLVLRLIILFVLFPNTLPSF